MSAAGLQIPETTRATQRRAADPRHSAWVSANAGSGKTFVLSRRVVRLLLAGHDPASILCITFTKAAAAEMETRIFGLLAEWTTLPDAVLSERLADLTGRPPAPGLLDRARRLFAIAVETPGRLKIQTIHAFCERLLQLFPFESGVPNGFDVLDERAARDLLRDAEASIFQLIDRDPDGDLARALDTVARHATETGANTAIRGLLGQRAALAAWRADADRTGDRETSLRAALGLGPDDGADALAEAILNGPNLPRCGWADAATALDGMTKATPQKQADKLRKALAARDPEAAIAAFFEIFFTQAGTPQKTLVVREVADRLPDLAARIEAEGDRLEDLRDRYRTARLLDANLALLKLSDAVLAAYDRAKIARGALDFDDLIARTVSLLSRRSAADWVLYKLDKGLDHILIDEAQDTSPLQWQVIGRLTEDFFSGSGQRGITRTLFAVGDPKQSIYSFQGAEPDAFDEMRRAYDRQTERRLLKERLGLSFRSVPHVLDAVDRVFAGETAATGLGARADYEPHSALRQATTGRVDLWPTVLFEEDTDPEPWDAPLDTVRAGAPAQRLAVRIAGHIADWLASGATLPARGRAILPKDILILLRQRNPLAGPIIRALKDRGVPVAGADRLDVTDHIGVQDLVALGRHCLLPEDDLSLAAVLKSPLIGLSEDDLFAIAHDRGPRPLSAALADAATDRPAFAVAHHRLTGWGTLARGVRPFEFFARVLAADDVSAAYRARYSSEIEDAFDAFLQTALDHDRQRTPSLAGFLDWLTSAPVELKRDMDQPDGIGPGAVRVMTVHGAKGLEAPIVILPDTCTLPDPKRSPRLFPVAGPDLFAPPQSMIWVPRKDDHVAATKGLLDAWQHRRIEEYHRLLYVAMTRAEDWLIVTGFETKSGRDQGCWYDLVDQALSDDLVEIDAPDSADDAPDRWRIRRFRPSPEAAPRPMSATDGAPAQAAGDTSPDWLFQPVARDPVTADGNRRRMARGRPETASAAQRRGSAIHRLLEQVGGLPPDTRATILAAGVGRADSLDPDPMATVRAILDDPAFAPLFGPNSRGEVTLAGRVTVMEGAEIDLIGRIDRLIVADDLVQVVDFKTDAQVPDDHDLAPDGYLDQLARYALLARSAFPGREIAAGILWTSAPRLDWIAANRIGPDRLRADRGQDVPAGFTQISQSRGSGRTP